MISYVLGTDLWLCPNLAQSMFRDRAIQFAERLKWQVDVDVRGFERDQYDVQNPIYVAMVDEHGTHEGSLRLLPTTGRTMINEHFLLAMGGKTVRDEYTWECTRFCLSRTAKPQTAAALLAGAGYLMQELGIHSIVAVFDRLMLRRYRASGAEPEVLGKAETSEGMVFAGKWQFSNSQLQKLMRRGSLDHFECEVAFTNSSLPGELELRSFESA